MNVNVCIELAFYAIDKKVQRTPHGRVNEMYFSLTCIQNLFTKEMKNIFQVSIPS